MRKLQKGDIRRINKYIKLAMKNAVTIERCYVRPSHYNWHLMQTRQAIISKRAEIFEDRIKSILNEKKIVKLHFLYANRIGECFCRIADIMTDTQYRQEDKAFHVFIPDFPIANMAQIELLSNSFEVISDTNLEFWEYFFTNYRDRIDVTDYERYRGRQKRYDIEAYKPIIDFSEQQKIEAENLMNDMGIDLEDDFICIHSRDSQYLKARGSNKEELQYHSHRNCDIENYFDSADFANTKGLKVVRLGKDVEKRVEHEGIIDYANTYSNPLLDLYLQRKCKYFIGTSCGLTMAAAVFGIPKVMANSEVLSIGWGSIPTTKYDLILPIKYWDQKKKRYLSFKEMLEAEILAQKNGNGLYYIKNNITPVQNSSEEILNATMELHESLCGNYSYTKEDEVLQNEFANILTQFSIEHNTSDELHGGMVQARIGADFLRKNKQLLK